MNWILSNDPGTVALRCITYVHAAAILAITLINLHLFV